jgi:hypothetical protein
MFLGHFGVAMAGKSVAPAASRGTLVLAAQLADGVWPILVLAGVEQVRIVPGITRTVPLDFVSYPWSHSLLADAGWALLLAALYGALRKDWRTAAWLGVLVLSHWVLDALSHRPDMPVWPGGPKVGLGLWDFLGATVVVEYVLFLGGAWLYLRATRARNRRGNLLFALFVITLSALYAASLLGPPPPDVRTLALTALAGWLFVAWGYWIDRNRVPAIAV